MQKTTLYLSAATLCAACLVSPAAAQTQRRNSHNFNLNVSMTKAEHCSDLKVSSNNGEIAQTSETFNMQGSEVPILELDDVAGRGVIHVQAWDRSDYAVETCKVAVADDRAAAEQLLRAIGVMRSAGRFATTGPVSDSGNWQLYFLIHTPKNANLDLHTTNGPIDVNGVTGNIKVRAVNGPLSLKDCGGQIDAQTTNGPISFHGSGGEVTLNAKNGPISVTLGGEMWNGTRLNASTANGPVSLSVPENFRSGIRLETSGHSPVGCGIEPCRNAWTDPRSDQKVLQLNGNQDTIRLTTGNGPVSINGPRTGRRVI